MKLKRRMPFFRTITVQMGRIYRKTVTKKASMLAFLNTNELVCICKGKRKAINTLINSVSVT